MKKLTTLILFAVLLMISACDSTNSIPEPETIYVNHPTMESVQIVVDVDDNRVLSTVSPTGNNHYQIQAVAGQEISFRLTHVNQTGQQAIQFFTDSLGGKTIYSEGFFTGNFSDSFVFDPNAPEVPQKRKSFR